MAAILSLPPATAPFSLLPTICCLPTLIIPSSKSKPRRNPPPSHFLSLLPFKSLTPLLPKKKKRRRRRRRRRKEEEAAEDDGVSPPEAESSALSLDDPQFRKSRRAAMARGGSKWNSNCSRLGWWPIKAFRPCPGFWLLVEDIGGAVKAWMKLHLEEGREI
uniref:Uncharacterized protein n=1 Tax=Ananas comosus var. bracteatus TaxID=296719 RepID=A0A6V7QJZ2_ANACO|nr:unnamed protein product [Ananas comosus var. bracteatus]